MTSKERARLRGLANGIETVLQIGKDGIGENLIRQADITLEARELIKGRVLDGCIHSPREAAEALAQATNSEVIQVIGSKFILYRKKKAAETEKKASKPHDGQRKASAGPRKPFRTDRDERRKPLRTSGDGQRKPFKPDRDGPRKAFQADHDGPRKPFKPERDAQRASRPGPRKASQSGYPGKAGAGPRKPSQSGRPGQRKPFSRPGKTDGGNRRK